MPSHVARSGSCCSRASIVWQLALFVDILLVATDCRLNKPGGDAAAAASCMQVEVAGHINDDVS